LKILVVDDSLMDRRLLISVLKKAGVHYEIIQAADGEEGLRVLSSDYAGIGLIFLDWQMPRMTGIDFMKAVVQIPEVAKIPLIMVTASGSDADKALALQVNPGLGGYLVKPYRPEILLQAVEPYLK
jgi:CheY-like chemotaxis protein